MNLNTKHFAGVSDIKETKGLPRLIEIFGARKQSSTPGMKIFLKPYNNDENLSGNSAPTCLKHC